MYLFEWDRLEHHFIINKTRNFIIQHSNSAIRSKVFLKATFNRCYLVCYWTGLLNKLVISGIIQEENFGFVYHSDQYAIIEYCSPINLLIIWKLLQYSKSYIAKI
jgi:hypothetical protein